MSALFWVAVGLLSAVTILHLYFSYREFRVPRMISKFFLVPLIILAVYGMGVNNILLYLALIFGYVGDIFMLWREKKWGLYGGFISFGIGHIFYIVLIILLLPTALPMWAFSVYFILLFSGAFLLATNVLKAKYGSYSTVLAIYGSLLVTLLVGAFVLAAENTSLLAGVVLAGSILFITSDMILGHMIFVRKENHENFYVMLPYILAQVGLGLGLAAIILG